MAFLPEKQYVAIEFGDAPRRKADADAQAEVAHSLERMALEADGRCRLTPTDPAIAEAAGAKPVALVTRQGKEARSLVRALAQAGFFPCYAYTADRLSEVGESEAPSAVCVGEVYSPELMGNSRALLSAAEKCGAAVILLDGDSAPLACVDSFIAHSAARHIQVFKPASATLGTLGWVLCQTTRPAEGDESWQVCPRCKLEFDTANLKADLGRCPACGGLFRMGSEDRLTSVLDEGSFEEWDADLPESDPLGFPGYGEKLAAQRERSGQDEAVRTGRGTIAGLPVAIGVMDSRFLMGSMGTVVGEKVTRLAERAIVEKLPVVMFSASGGARMQEGIISLMQMAKTSAAFNRLGEHGLPFISVLTDPTTGGVTASFAMEGDIVLAEPRALIGFAGQRVIRDTIKQELPEGFQTAEFALEHGLIDAVVPRENMRNTLAHLLAIHMATGSEELIEERGGGVLVDYRSVCDNLERGATSYNRVTLASPAEGAETLADALRRYGTDLQPRAIRRLQRLEERRRRADEELDRALDALRKGADPLRVLAEDMLETEPVGAAASSPVAGTGADRDQGNSAWDSVLLARNTHRPTARTYIDAIVDGFIELHGDRAFSDDGAILAGLGWIGHMPVTVIAEEKGANLNERIRRNFGCPQPEGYRKSLRLMRQAEKFGRPVVCIVDTQGAFCGTDAEERGQGNAIADNLISLAGLKVPVVSVLIGEGGSGGALALAVADRVAMLKHAVYSVLSPEGFASILWKDRTRAPEAAAVMKISADDALSLGVIDAVLDEGEEGAHADPSAAVASVDNYLRESLEQLSLLSEDELLDARYARFRKF